MIFFKNNLFQIIIVTSYHRIKATLLENIQKTIRCMNICKMKQKIKTIMFHLPSNKIKLQIKLSRDNHNLLRISLRRGYSQNSLILVTDREILKIRGLIQVVKIRGLYNKENSERGNEAIKGQDLTV